MTSNDPDVYDLVGIGFGPANLALAVALDECPAASNLRALFIEQKPAFAWHPHMLLDDTVMQISFLKDLVTQRNPESRFTFINYLKSHGRLADFINLKSFYPTRVEFNRYLAWVAAQVRTEVRYGSAVVSVSRANRAPRQLVEVRHRDVATGEVRRVFARNLVVAVGGKPNMQLAAEVGADSLTVWHSANYLNRVERLGPLRPGHRFVVVGRGQSAAEIANDLHGRFPDAAITCIFRGYGLKPSDSSEFVNGIFDADFVDQLHEATPELRARLLTEHQDTNYAVVDAPLISRLFQIQYAERVSGPVRLRFRNLTQVLRVDETPLGVQVSVRDTRTGAQESLDADTVVLATGYAYPNPPTVLQALTDDLHIDPDTRRPTVNRHFRATTRGDVQYGIYLQGCNEATHGLSDTLLSNLSIRAGEILADVLQHATAKAVTPAAPVTRDATPVS